MELKLHPNVPPQGLSEYTFYREPIRPGVQGLAWSVTDSAWASAVSLPPQTECPGLLWLEVATLSPETPFMLGNIYLEPGHAALGLVSDILHQVLDDVSRFAPGTRILLTGDVNVDFVYSHGSAHQLLAAFLRDSGLVLVPKASPAAFSRGASGYQVDHFMVSTALFNLLALPVVYHHNVHLGSSTGRCDSDHSPLSLHLKGCRRVVCHMCKVLRFNLSDLREGRLLPYQTLLTSMLCKWAMWRKSLVECVGFRFTPALVTVLFAGFIYVVHHSAYMALGLKASQVMVRPSRPFLTHRLPSDATQMWSYVKTQRRAQQQHSSLPFSKEQMVEHMMSVYSVPLPRGSPRSRRFVDAASLQLDVLPPLPYHYHALLVTQMEPVQRLLCARLRVGTAGGPIDRHPPELYKFGPPALHTALAVVGADFAVARFVPDAAIDGLMSYMHKGRGLPRSSLDSYRGIRCTSVPGKLVCRALASPVVEVNAYFAEALGFEQFAGRRFHSADMLAVLLWTILHLNGSKPLFVVLLDVTKAFDRVWREALWAKLLAQGHPPHVVAWLRAAYVRLRTAVKGDGSNSEFHSSSVGIGQGDVNSTNWFAIFLADFPAHLKRHGASFELLGLLLVCFLFLDDIAALAHSVDEVCSVLHAAHLYEEEWSVTFSKSKSCV